MSAVEAPPDPLAAVPPPAELRRQLADLTRRRTLMQVLLRARVRIANYQPSPADRLSAAADTNPPSR